MTVYSGLVTAHLTGYGTFVPAQNMLQMATMMMGPKVSKVANLAYFLYWQVVQNFQYFFLTKFL